MSTIVVNYKLRYSVPWVTLMGATTTNMFIANMTVKGKLYDFAVRMDDSVTIKQCLIQCNKAVKKKLRELQIKAEIYFKEDE